MVTESQSIEGAKMVARSEKQGYMCMYIQCHLTATNNRFFQKMKDYSSALQFLVMSHCTTEAYSMAEVCSETDYSPEL